MARNYVNLRVKYKHPVSIAQVKAEEKKQETTTKKDTTTTKNSTTTTKNSTTKKDSTTTTKDSTTLSEETDNTNDTAKKKVTGSQIANYAKKFWEIRINMEDKPYKWSRLFNDLHRAYIRSLDMIFQELRLSSHRMGQKFQFLHKTG